jgi:hypothetical protein
MRDYNIRDKVEGIIIPKRLLCGKVVVQYHHSTLQLRVHPDGYPYFIPVKRS